MGTATGYTGRIGQKRGKIMDMENVHEFSWGKLAVILITIAAAIGFIVVWWTLNKRIFG
jgi:hypothetical protein